MRNWLTLILVMALSYLPIEGAADPAARTRYEINTLLMEVTFRLVGPSKSSLNAVSGGTVFLMGKAISNQPNRARYVMITAAHVLNDIVGDVATIHDRRKNADGTITVVPRAIAIRENGKPLYVIHPSADVAAMYVKMPTEFNERLLPMDLLATDELLKKYEIHPGDELNCLGYPLLLSGEYGYPILRSGKIASYPIVPMKQHKNLLFDFSIFPGNSGGPVYFSDHNRTYGDSLRIGETIQFVVGLVTARFTQGNQDLQLAKIVPSVFIREAVEMLPPENSND